MGNIRNDEWQAAFLDQQDSPATRETYRIGINLFRSLTQDRDFTSITVFDLIKFKDHLATMTWAPATQVTRWKAVQALFRWLTTVGEVSKNPMLGVKPPKTTEWRPRAATEEQVKDLYAAIPSDTDRRDIRDRAIIALMANGLRVSEVVNLQLRDLTWEGGDTTMYLEVHGKGGKVRTVPLHDDTALALQDWLKVSDDDHGPHMFTEVYGYENQEGDAPITRRMAQRAVERARGRAKHKDISSHSLRHYYATRLVKRGVAPFAIMRLLGHSSITTTQVYVSLDMADLERELEKDVDLESHYAD